MRGTISFCLPLLSTSTSTSTSMASAQDGNPAKKARVDKTDAFPIRLASGGFV